ncbi:hypothetical protein GCM10022251_54520 [Phytohabitans flavus]|uniref:Uncharacterized protein n=1 Tax=Phytohabitans flavus TaxID=1076124 RepID=A0A6F8XMD4_9ACTN|nr:hypothetical protein [Phytohabitans flavus]BCB74949.1 hypothetical protein Pflav_013590 [Phytohabitans flavus]
MAAKWVAAATGSATSATADIPARRAASASTARRREPQAAGWVNVVAAGGPPATRDASRTTRANTAATRSTTGTS